MLLRFTRRDRIVYSAVDFASQRYTMCLTIIVMLVWGARGQSMSVRRNWLGNGICDRASGAEKRQKNEEKIQRRFDVQKILESGGHRS